CSKRGAQVEVPYDTIAYQSLRLGLILLGLPRMKTLFARVVAIALLGLATTAVTVAKAGDYKAIVNGSERINLPVPNIQQTFRELDRDGNGVLSMGEFWKVDRLLGRLQVGTPGIPFASGYVTRIGPFWSNTDLTNLFLTLDSNRDGVVSLQEFAAINYVAP